MPTFFSITHNFTMCPHMFKKSKLVYTPSLQSRTGGQERNSERKAHFMFWLPTDQRTDERADRHSMFYVDSTLQRPRPYKIVQKEKQGCKFRCGFEVLRLLTELIYCECRKRKRERTKKTARSLKKEGKKNKREEKKVFVTHLTLYHLLFLHSLLTYVWFGIKVARRRLSCELGIESGKQNCITKPMK